MSSQNPSTDDILAQIRGGGKPSTSASEEKQALEPAVETNSAEESPVANATEGKTAPAPSGTAGILDSIRTGGAAAAPVSSEAKVSGQSTPGKASPAGTVDIMASIRGGGGAAPAAAVPAPKAAAASEKVDTAKAAGMTAAEMIHAARKGVVTADPVTGESRPVAKKVVLPSKPLPGKVSPPRSAKGAVAAPRRSFLRDAVDFLLSPVVIAWGSLIGATTVSSLGIARFMMGESGALIEPPTKFKIGPPTDYGTGTVSTKWKAQFGVWVVNDEIDGQQMIYALSTVCTHLGCTPNWLEGEQKFKCPCHGSGFYKTGINFEGPAPRPLERHGIRLAEDGMLEVDKSVKFQRELGQWSNSASFVSV